MKRMLLIAQCVCAFRYDGRASTKVPVGTVIPVSAELFD